MLKHRVWAFSALLSLTSSVASAAGAFEYNYVELKLGEGKIKASTELDYDIQSLEFSIQPGGRGSAMFSFGYAQLDDIAISDASLSLTNPEMDQETYFFTLGNELWGNSRTSVTAKLAVAISKLRSDIDSIDGTDGKQAAVLLDSRIWLTNYLELGVSADFSYIDIGEESESGPGAAIALAYHLTHAVRLGFEYGRSEVYDESDVDTKTISIRFMF